MCIDVVVAHHQARRNVREGILLADELFVT